MKLSEIRGKEVLSKDGRDIGTIDGAILKGKWKVDRVSIKIDNNVVETLGKKKPLLFSLRQDLNIDHIEAIDDRVILDKDIKGLAHYLHRHNDEMNAGRILGMEIVDSKGKLIGKAEDLLLHCVTDCDEWGMPSIIVNIDKEAVEDIELKKALLSTPRIQINMKHVSNMGDVILLGVDSKEMVGLINKSEIKVA